MSISQPSRSLLFVTDRNQRCKNILLLAVCLCFPVVGVETALVLFISSHGMNAISVYLQEYCKEAKTAHFFLSLISRYFKKCQIHIFLFEFPRKILCVDGVT